MKSFFAVAATLLFAAFASASPLLESPSSLGGPLDTRCSTDACCGTGNFFYNAKSCCLPSGGPTKNTPVGNPNPGTDCPKDWYFHRTHACCVPKNKPSNPSNPSPNCATSTYWRWDRESHCCKPGTPTNPNPPQNSPQPGRPGDNHHYKRKASPAHAKKSQQKGLSRDDGTCPDNMLSCGNECFDNEFDIRACGGCPSAGGQDCSAIPNQFIVECKAIGSAPTCVVHSCNEGFVPSKDGKSCVASL